VRRQSRQIDFTQGGLVIPLILFVVPLVLSEMLQTFYNSVDAIVVGNAVGKSALAAVSICSPIANLLIGFFNGMSVGTSVVVSQACGRGRGDELSCTVRVVYGFSALMGICLSAAGVLTAPWLLQLVRVPEELFGEAVVYLRIYLSGLMCTILYNIGAGILRALGDATTPFLILFSSSLLNVVLDVLFVVRFAMGLVGVAAATVIAQLLSAVLIYRRLCRAVDGFQLDTAELVRNRPLIVRLLAIGLPAGLQSSLVLLSNLFVQRYINGFGSSVIAGVGATHKIDKFLNYPCKAFGFAVTTVIGQNAGAGMPQRAA